MLQRFSASILATMMAKDVKVDIEEMLAKAQPLFTNECCIYKVPHEIRQLNEDAYTPVLVSIGPFHHGSEKLLKMEGHKQVYCQHFIERSQASLDDLMSCVRQLEPQVRRCYSENIDLGVDELVKVLLVDCGFMIELFLKEFHQWNDVILLTPWLIERITKDLLLLENQLPFFAFEKLYNLAFLPVLNCNRYPPFLLLACHFLRHFNESRVVPPFASNMAHFTDLLRTFYLQPFNRRPSREVGKVLTLRYSASELKEAGVKFTKNKTSHSLLDFKFSCCILKIPPITVDDNIEMLLRNMVALEQCHYPTESCITNYAEFLDCLIDTDKDVDVLVKHEIINNCLGDNNSVAKLFNGLAKNIVVSDCNADYLRICKELTGFYENCWHSKMATLRRDYCNTPWKTVASIAGIILLILTAIQTVYSIL